MVVLGYIPATGRDAAGHRVHGIRLYCADHVGGVTGQLSASVFVPDGILDQLGAPVDMLIGRHVRIAVDAFGRVIELELAGIGQIGLKPAGHD